MILVQIVVENPCSFAAKRLRVLANPRAQQPQQAVAGTQDFREQIVLRAEVGIEGAARKPSRQHDVVDGGCVVAAQTEEAGGMIEYFLAGPSLAVGVDRHGVSPFI